MISDASIVYQCIRILLTTFNHIHITLCSYWGYGQVFIHYKNVNSKQLRARFLTFTFMIYTRIPIYQAPTKPMYAGASRTSLGYQPLHKREEVSGNLAILLLCKWNVVNVIFTMLWTVAQVGANQNQCARANDHSTTYWHDSKPIAHSASKYCMYCTWRSHVHIPDTSTTRV